MAKARPDVDLAALTSAAAVPMTEAKPRQIEPSTPPAEAELPSDTSGSNDHTVKTADLLPLSFKVPPLFRRRFRQRALDANLKLNDLLFDALDAWEEKRGLK